MMAVAGIRNIWLARYRIDFRKGHWSLLAEAYSLGLNPLAGDALLFVARDKRKMKIIMDYSWNHVGTTFWAWLDVLKNQQASPYKDWFDIKSFDNPATSENEFSYNGWLNIPSLPELKKVNVTTFKQAGHPCLRRVAHRQGRISAACSRASWLG